MAASTAPASQSGLYANPREDWLAQYTEEIIDPARPIVDPHHHLWDRGGLRYMIEDMVDDIASGHNIIATVYVDCRSMYRANGPEAFRPVGEVEFANGVAAMSASGGYGKAQINAGIVSHVNLLLGDGAKAGAGSRDRRRQWPLPRHPAFLGMGRRARSRRHVCEAAARACCSIRPSARVLPASRRSTSASMPGCFIRRSANSPISPAPFPIPKSCSTIAAARSASAASPASARRPLRCGRPRSSEIAKCPNVVVKLGGLAMCLLGYDFHLRPKPPSSEQAAAAWRPYIETCIEAFGPDRAMFESNFPPDKGQCSYQVIFNAFKRIAAQYSEAEKTALFSKTATDFYRLKLA